MKGRIVAVAALAIFVMLFAQSAVAQKINANGVSLYLPIESDSFELPDGRTVERSVNTGFSVDLTGQEQPGNEICSGTRVSEADGEGFFESGHCVGIDIDGDMWWLWFRNTEAGGEYHFTGGTGKFKGITGGGKSEVTFEWADGKYFDTWKGSWEIPE